MNFAQLIDPDWVRRGCPERVERRRPAAEKPLRVVTQVYAEPLPPQVGRHTGLARRVHTVLRAALSPLQATDVALAAGEITVQQANTVLHVMYKRGDVGRLGSRGQYRFALTAQGRASGKGRDA